MDPKNIYAVPYYYFGSAGQSHMGAMQNGAARQDLGPDPTALDPSADRRSVGRRCGAYE